MNLLVQLKTLLARVMVVIEFCHDCGRRQPVVWTADDAVWEEFARHDNNPLCPDCFDKRATQQGVMLRWVPQIECRRPE